MTVHVIMAILAAWRITEIITQDLICEGIRNWWGKRFATKRYANFLSCTRCVSVWAGVISTMIFIVAPLFNWPLAMSILYLLCAGLLTRLAGGNQRKITILPDQQRVEWGPFDARFGMQIMKQIIDSMEHPPQSPVQVNPPSMVQGNSR